MLSSRFAQAAGGEGLKAHVARMALAVLLGLPLDRLWSIRIGYATRVRVEMGSDPAHGLWGRNHRDRAAARGGSLAHHARLPDRVERGEAGHARLS
ncbi:MAG: hypothetical protein HC767_14245 [Akkermansiaceae bacterium]|nr:hypothetical protein [Akkermansiaceae bacterium]